VRNRWTRPVVAVAIAALAVLVAAVGAGATKTAAPASPAAVSGSISFDGVWTGGEAAAFQAVINGFKKVYPKVKVNYKPVGDNLPTVLSTAVAGGNPPDMADIAQPGLVQQFVTKKALKPITYAAPVVKANFAPVWRSLGTYNGKLYGLIFKASNKSTVWYNAHSFSAAGVKAPTTWTQFLANAKTIHASGTPAYSIGGADGWTLTDLFENIYLRQAGQAKYLLLTAHKIPWTDASVKAALTTMGKVLGDSSNLYGGTSGAVQTDFPTSVNNVFENPPKAAIVMEGDFVPGVATVKATPVTDYNEFPFPSILPSTASSVEVGGDTIVTFRDNPAIEAFVKYLATAPAAAIWAHRGGYATGNNKMSPAVYPDAITRKTAAAIAAAKYVVFDMSDQQPGAFGATVGQGEWGIFQDFLRNPSDVNGIAAKLEASAAAAYKGP